jgi:UPF0716 protein FxsA
MSERRGRLRPRQVLGFVLLGFVAVVVVEIAVAVLVARLIGPWPTMLLIVAFSFAGLMVVRQAGARSVQALRQAAAQRRLPGGELADHALLLLGGVLMIPPGFVLDLLGLVFVLPFTRPLARRLVGLVLRGRVFVRVAQSWPGYGGPPVVPGEVVRDDELGPGPGPGDG